MTSTQIEEVKRAAREAAKAYVGQFGHPFLSSFAAVDGIRSELSKLSFSPTIGHIVVYQETMERESRRLCQQAA